MLKILLTNVPWHIHQKVGAGSPDRLDRCSEVAEYNNHDLQTG